MKARTNFAHSAFTNKLLLLKYSFHFLFVAALALLGTSAVGQKPVRPQLDSITTNDKPPYYNAEGDETSRTLFKSKLPPEGYAQTHLQHLADSILGAGRSLYWTQKSGETALELFNTKLSGEAVVGHFTAHGEDFRHTLFFNKKGQLVYEIYFLDDVDAVEDASISRGEDRPASKLERTAWKAVQKLHRKLAKEQPPFVQPNNIEFHTVVDYHETGFTVHLLPYAIVKSLVPFGNDYRIEYNKRGKLQSIESLHQELVPVESRPLVEHDEEAAAGVHVHASTGSPFITATDIATLLAYQDYVDWRYHVVLSANWASIFSMETGELVIQPRSEFEKGL